MDALTILTEARATIADPERWCRETLARVGGYGVSNAIHPAAEQWCAIGAACKAAGVRHAGADIYKPDPFDRAFDLLTTAAKERDFASVADCNDSTDHEGVLALYDRAIALATPASPED